jgi:hypothetical protein
LPSCAGRLRRAPAAGVRSVSGAAGARRRNLIGSEILRPLAFARRLYADDEADVAITYRTLGIPQAILFRALK